MRVADDRSPRTVARARSPDHPRLRAGCRGGPAHRPAEGCHRPRRGNARQSGPQRRREGPRAANGRPEDRQRDLRLRRDRPAVSGPLLAAPLRAPARRVRRTLRRPPRALVHLEDRAVRRGEDRLQRRARGRRPRHRQHQDHDQERHRRARRLSALQAQRPVDDLRRQRGGDQPRLQLPDPVQQDHPDERLQWSRGEDEDEADRVRGRRSPEEEGQELAGGRHRPGAGDARPWPERRHAMTGRDLADLLDEHGYDFFTGVPCSLVEALLAELETRAAARDARSPYIPSVREDIAIGLAAGAWLGGRAPAVVMQNSGLGTSLDALVSLSLLYRLPALLLVTWRGHGGADAPEHILMGEISPALLDLIRIPHRVLTATGAAAELHWAKTESSRLSQPVALLVPPGLLE